MTVINGLGLLLLIIGTALYLGFAFLVRQGLKPDFRPLSAYQNLFSQIGQAVESGGRMHVAFGPNAITGEDAVTLIAGLEVLDIIAETSSISDRSPIASTSDAAAMFLISDSIRRAYKKRDLMDRYETMSARLVALDPIAYAGGTASVVSDDEVRANVLLGSFGPEVALIAAAGERQRIPQIIGSDRLEAQAIAYAMADHPLIGEEMFVTNAYILRDGPATGSVLAQDVLRWIAIAIILVGVVLSTVGLI